MRKVFLSIEQDRGYGRGLISGITQYSKLFGPWSFYTRTPFYYRKSKKEQRAIDIIKQWRPDGIIMREDQDIEDIMTLGIPSIFITYTKIEVPGCVALLGDHEVCGKLAAEHLIARGFKNFAFCGVPNKYWSQYREESFKKRVKEAGFEVCSFPFSSSEMKINWLKDQGKLKKWLTKLPKPVGIMACTDDRAQNVIEACKAAELHVPQDVAVVGVDNDELLCGLVNPPLSSVSLDAFNAGYYAAESLDSIIKGKTPAPEKTIIAQATHVVIRQSSDIFAVDDQDIRIALRYISDNANQAIQVKDVADACGLTVRVLQRKFKCNLGKSVSDLIDKARIELICRILIESPKSINQIAHDIDFISENHFSRYFRRLMEVSPSAYRKKINSL